MYNNQSRNHSGHRRQNREDRPRNSTISVNLFELAKNNKGEYNREGLLDILGTLPFDKISIPVYTYKNLMFDKNSKGTMVVGYIKSYDAENESFEVVIYGNYVETVGNFEDAVIFPRVFIDEESRSVRSIIGLDICPLETYDYLFGDEE